VEFPDEKKINEEVTKRFAVSGFFPHSSRTISINQPLAEVADLIFGDHSKPRHEIDVPENSAFTFSILMHEFFHLLCSQATTVGIALAVSMEEYIISSFNIAKNYQGKLSNPIQRDNLIKIIEDEGGVEVLLKDNEQYSNNNLLSSLRYFLINDQIIEEAISPCIQHSNFPSVLDIKKCSLVKKNGKYWISANDKHYYPFNYLLVIEGIASIAEQITIQNCSSKLNQTILKEFNMLPLTEIIKFKSNKNNIYGLFNRYLQFNLPDRFQTGSAMLLICELILQLGATLIKQKDDSLAVRIDEAGEITEKIFAILHRPDCPDVVPHDLESFYKFYNYIIESVSGVPPQQYYNDWGNCIIARMEDSIILGKDRWENCYGLFTALTDKLFFAPRLPFDLFFFTKLFKIVKPSVFAPDVIYLSRFCVSYTYGIVDEEFLFNIIRNLVEGIPPVCHFNCVGICRGPLYGENCDDSLTSNNWKPCGFFDHQAEIKNIFGIKTPYSQPKDNFTKLIDFYKKNKKTVILEIIKDKGEHY